MLDKIGVHFNDSNGVPEAFEKWQMPLCVLKDHSPEPWREAKAISPQTILIGRVTPDEGTDWMTADAVIEAKLAYDRIMPMAERMEDIVDFFIQWNEPTMPNGPEGTDAMKRYSLATSNLTRLLARQGVRSAVGGFAEGNPRLSFWEHYLPALRTAMTHGGIAHVHEYDWKYLGATMPWRSLRLSQVIFGNWVQENPAYLDEWDGLPQDLFEELTWAITEFGLDRGEGIRQGWKTATQNQHEAYISQIEWYNTYWMAQRAEFQAPPEINHNRTTWDNLAGIAIFAKGNGTWKDYRIDGPCFNSLAKQATPLYYDVENITPDPPDPPIDPKPPEEKPPMIQSRPHVGLHLRNAQNLTPGDHTILHYAKIESVKAMTPTMDTREIYNLLGKYNVEDIIVRLYESGKPQISNFVAKHTPALRILAEHGIHKVEVLNEPNHAAGIEGWGPTKDDARDFAAWFDIVAPTLREAIPQIEIGFPGLAVPGFVHHDLNWLQVCRDTITRNADWLGCHCYWQHDNRTARAWGKRFLHYHNRFPNLPIEITEFGDSTPNLTPQEQAHQITAFYQMIEPYTYIRSAHAFIQSSPDPQWGSLPFSWTHDGTPGPVTYQVGSYQRPPLYTTNPGTLAGYKYIGNRLTHHETETYPHRSLAAIDSIIIHHTAIPATIPANQIANYHVHHNDWPGIGYHFYQKPTKTALQTQTLNTVSAHCKDHNLHTVGIGVAGMFNDEPPPPYQLRLLAELCTDLITHLGLPGIPIFGHHEMTGHTSNACPGHTWKRKPPRWMSQLMNLTQAILEGTHAP